MIVDLLNSITRSPYWVAAGWTMLHFLWIGLAIAVATLLLLRSLDRARPEIRHAAVSLVSSSSSRRPCRSIAHSWRKSRPRRRRHCRQR
jgi:hypothetical protein